MASDKFKICSLACLELGLKPIDSFQDQTNLNVSRVCGDIWDDYSRYLLSLYSWRFTMKKRQLSRLVEVPVNEWQYKYQLPSDLLNLRAVFNDEGITVVPEMRYEIFEDHIYTNQEFIYVDYQAYVEPDKWPYWFVEFAVKAFAGKLAPILTDKQDVAAQKQQDAFGPLQDNLNGGLLGQAKRIDSQRMPSEPIHSFPLIIGRFGSWY